jgi:hypothetical protein
LEEGDPGPLGEVMELLLMRFRGLGCTFLGAFGALSSESDIVEAVDGFVALSGFALFLFELDQEGGRTAK